MALEDMGINMPEEAKESMIIYDRFKSDKDFILEVKRILDNDLEIAKEGKQYTSFYWEVLPCDEKQEVYLHLSEIDEYINSVMEDKKLTLNNH